MQERNILHSEHWQIQFGTHQNFNKTNNFLLRLFLHLQNSHFFSPKGTVKFKYIGAKCTIFT